MNLYELSEIADKRFSHGEEIPQNIIEGVKQIVSNGGFIGMVAGTGTNTCCMLPERRIAKLGLHGDGKMLVNLESGSFDGFPRGDFDLEMDNALPDTGYYIAEKMCSGAYLGEVSRYTLQAAAREGLFSASATEYLLHLPELTTPTADAWASGKLPECFEAVDKDIVVYIIREFVFPEQIARLHHHPA